MENFGKFLVLGAASAAVGYYIYRRYRAGMPLEEGGASRLVLDVNPDLDYYFDCGYDCGEFKDNVEEELLNVEEKDNNVGEEKKVELLKKENDRNITSKLEDLKKRFYEQLENVTYDDNAVKDYESDREFDSDELEETLNEILSNTAKNDDNVEEERKDELLEEEKDDTKTSKLDDLKRRFYENMENVIIDSGSQSFDEFGRDKVEGSPHEEVPPVVDKGVRLVKRRGKFKGLRKFFKRLSCMRKAGGEE